MNDVNMISLFEAQVSADRQTASVVIPLWEKSFTLNGTKINVIDFVKEEKLQPNQIEEICNLQVGEGYPLPHQSSTDIIKRVE